MEDSKQKKIKTADVFDSDTTQKMLSSAASDILEKLEISGDTLTQSGLLSFSDRTFQALAVRLQPDSRSSGINKLLASEILLTSERLERQCANSGYLFAKVLLRTLQDSSSTRIAGQQDPVVFEKLRRGIVAEKHVGIPAAVNKRTGMLHGSRTDPTRHALNVSGLLGSVVVEKYTQLTPGSETIIESSGGYEFPVEMMHTFLSSLLLSEFQSWEAQEVRVLIVDGVLSTVAEIDKILLGASRHKQPTLVVASYFEEEVVATVAANNLAGRTNIFLCLLPRDSLEGVNMANDIAVCCLADPINAHSGHSVLGLLEYDALATVDSIRIIPASKKLSIRNGRAKTAVETQLTGLQEKIAELTHSVSDNKVRHATAELLNKRITNLVGDRTTVKVPASRANVLIPKIDNEIRLVKSLLQYGELNNTVKFRKWFRNVTLSSSDPICVGAGRALLEELQMLHRENSSLVLPGIVPYFVMWFVVAVARQYLETGCSVIRN